MKTEKKIETIAVLMFIFTSLLSIGLLGGVAWVAIHFISKWW